MNTSENDPPAEHQIADADAEELRREKVVIERGGRLHLVHWFVLCLSLILTVAAWQYAKSQAEKIAEERFSAYADQVVELVTERMGRYEDALWGGVAAINSKGGDVSHAEWKKYADSLRIVDKYPGINGMGVIHRVTREERSEYLAQQRAGRPGYRIHPPHAQNEYYPISYIEPVEINRAAVGLDMAHETNRYTAVKKARDTGLAQITGPIVLVQDSEKTPGFLFFAPFYKAGDTGSAGTRQILFTGVVYAPFIVKRLMAGTLDKEKRDVSVRISDERETIYDELTDADPDFDPQPLYTRKALVPMFGRNWTFDIRSANSFRASFDTDQPLLILAGGLLIDALLLSLFVSLTRANRRATAFAGRMSRSALEKADDLERLVGNLAKSNQELERFAYVASHDLQEPLRMVRSFTGLLETNYARQLDDRAREYISIASSAAERMQALISGLLDYARIDVDTERRNPVDLNKTLEYVLHNLSEAIEASGAEITSDELPTVQGDDQRIARVLQNLLVNAVKYQSPGKTPAVHVSAVRGTREWVVTVSDNGIGIPDKFREDVFSPFRRLHGQQEYSGTGMGLAICRRIVESTGGAIWVESNEGAGSRFSFSLPVEESKSSIVGVEEGSNGHKN